MLTMTVGIMGYCTYSQFSGIHRTRTKGMGWFKTATDIPATDLSLCDFSFISPNLPSNVLKYIRNMYKAVIPAVSQPTPRELGWRQNQGFHLSTRSQQMVGFLKSRGNQSRR